MKFPELKKQADEKFATSLKNQAQLEQQLKDLQGQLAKEGGSNPATEKQIADIKNKLNKEKQIGVPFNISWGGGTLGLRENLTYSSCTYHADNSHQLAMN